jgi:hypothetical protein
VPYKTMEKKHVEEREEKERNFISGAMQVRDGD